MITIDLRHIAKGVGIGLLVFLASMAVSTWVSGQSPEDAADWAVPYASGIGVGYCLFAEREGV